MENAFEYADELGPAKVIHVYEPSIGLRGTLVIDNVATGPSIGGMRMASVMLRPTVVNFLDEMLRVTGQTLRVEEVHVDATSPLAHRTIRDADIGRRTGVLVVALKPHTGGYGFNPGPQTVLKPGDVLIVIGTPQQLAALRQS